MALERSLLCLLWFCALMLFAWLFPGLMFVIMIVAIEYWPWSVPVLVLGLLAIFASRSRRHHY